MRENVNDKSDIAEIHATLILIHFEIFIDSALSHYHLRAYHFDPFKTQLVLTIDDALVMTNNIDILHFSNVTWGY